DDSILTIDATQPLEQVTSALHATLTAWLAEQRA
ncbi:dTMP kinase, partial [Salmonella enterica]|nr:dTMP kinase [Salmonella enterica]